MCQDMWPQGDFSRLSMSVTFTTTTARRGQIRGSVQLADGSIAQWLERLTADQQVPGSNPGWPFCSTVRARGQVCVCFDVLASGIVSPMSSESRCTHVVGGDAAAWAASQELVCRVNKKWTHWGLSPGPSACEADVIPLHHVPLESIGQCCFFVVLNFRRRVMAW